MKMAAGGLLGLMTAVFILASLASARWPNAAYVRAFAEAAMVGACADWFAVTALFRRPFGLPIPHTAIIPRSKDRIGRSLGRFIVGSFLSPRVLDSKVRQLQLAAWGGAWLQRPANARRLAERMLVWGPQIIRVLPAGALQSLAGSAAKAALKAVPAAPTASALLAALWNEGAAQPIIERLAAVLKTYLQDHEEVILDAVQAQSWRWMPSWVDRTIARKISAGLIQVLTDVQQPGHPWRAQIGAGVDALVVRLATDPRMRRRGEVLKARILKDPRLRGHAQRLWSQIEQQLSTPQAAGSGGAQDRLEQLIVDMGLWLSRDLTVQRTLNTGARALVRHGVGPHREDIGRFVAQVVDSWDTPGLVDRLELQVGPDLQFIRINGTLVGGLIGLILFALSRLVHLQ